MAKKRSELGNDTYFTIYNSDLKLIKDPVKKILYSKIKNWIYRNEDKKSARHFKLGDWWTFGTYEYWAEECGLETRTVGTHLRELVASGILKKGNFNKFKGDKTIWYRLATNDEMKNVNYRVLFYGKANELNLNNYSNELLLEMYQNGMKENRIKEVKEEKMRVAIPEDNAENITEHKLENNPYDKTNQKEENINTLLEKYYNLIEDNNIINHVVFLSEFNVEDIPTKISKLFLDKFHEKNIDSIKNEDELFTYKYRIDGMYENKLNPQQLRFCWDLATKYFDVEISHQPVDQKSDEVSSTIKSSTQIPLNLSSEAI